MLQNIQKLKLERGFLIFSYGGQIGSDILLKLASGEATVKQFDSVILGTED